MSDWNPKMLVNLVKLVKRTLLSALALAALAGCSYFQFPGVHRVEVQQGNIVTQEMIDQLRPGMTKAQVRYVMGTPLVADTFNQDRWDYYYSKKEGRDLIEKETVTVYFDNDRLTRIVGDYQPAAAETAE